MDKYDITIKSQTISTKAFYFWSTIFIFSMLYLFKAFAAHEEGSISTGLMLTVVTISSVFIVLTVIRFFYGLKDFVSPGDDEPGDI